MLKLGIVGLGTWGQILVRSIQENGRHKSEIVQFTSGYTRSPAKHRDFAARQGLTLFDSYQDLLRSKSVEGVVIASPHTEHVEQICQAAEVGLHIFVEKPLALDVAGARESMDAVIGAGKRLAVGFNRRFLPAYLRLRDVIRDGRLGQILHIEGNFSGTQGKLLTPEVWHARASETPAGGMTLMGVHVLDAMIGLAGPIGGVRARSRKQFLSIDLDDTTDAALEFTAGCTGYLSTITATARNWRLQVFGTKGWAEMQGYQQLTIGLEDRNPETIQFAIVDIERAELEAFAACVLKRTDYPVPIEEVLSGIGALEAIYTSAKEDRFVAVSI